MKDFSNQIILIFIVSDIELVFADVMHCFEVRTVNVDYLVGADPLAHLSGPGGSVNALPPPDSGVGAYLAKSWETAIRQSLMPVTQQSGNKHTMLVVSRNLLLSYCVGSEGTLGLQDSLRPQASPCRPHQFCLRIN